MKLAFKDCWSTDMWHGFLTKLATVMRPDIFRRLMLILLCAFVLPAAPAISAEKTPPEKQGVALYKVLDVNLVRGESVSLIPYFATLEDTRLAMTLADVQGSNVAKDFVTHHSTADAFNFGFTGAAYWFRLHLRNASESRALRFLEISNPELDHVALYQQDATGNYQSIVTGNATPFASRPYLSRHFVFPVTVLPHVDQVLYLRIQATSAFVPVAMWEPESFYAHEREDYLVQGWYFGMVLGMVVLNIFLFVMLREKLYLYYFISVICLALFVAEQHGLAKQYLWPNAILWSRTAFQVTAISALSSYLLFSRHFLNTMYFLPRVNKWLKFIACSNLAVPFVLLVSTPFVFGALIPFAILEMLLAFGAIVYFMKKGHRSGYYAMAAFSLLILGGVITNLKTLAVIPSNFFTTYAMEIGSAVEMMLLAFALADRFHLIRSKAISDVQNVNASLEARLQEQKAELTSIHQQLRESEQSKLLGQERQRMTQDMHDGLGSSLIAALHSVERGKLNENDIVDVLRGCIDDLKLAIDSMEEVEADLLLLLATLRFRLAPRLESAGLQLHWHVGDVPNLPWLTPSSSLHILRILQEAITNIIKHAQATHITVTTEVQGDGVLITVMNDGLSFDVDAALIKGGKGLQNQLRRAETIGATVSWKSLAAGTALHLHLPLSNPIKETAPS